MFIPIPHSQIKEADRLTGWSTFALVGAPQTGAWFVATVVVGRDLSCHTMLFANAQVMVAVMDGPEYKKVVTLVMVTVRSLEIETHRIRRVWGSADQPDLDLVAESFDGDHLVCSTGVRTPFRSGLSVLLEIPYLGRP